MQTPPHRLEDLQGCHVIQYSVAEKVLQAVEGARVQPVDLDHEEDPF